MSDQQMTVKDLREQLEGLPDDLPVYLQRDPEGNGFEPLYAVEPDACCDGYGEMSWGDHEDNEFESAEDWEQFKAENRACVILQP